MAHSLPFECADIDPTVVAEPSGDSRTADKRNAVDDARHLCEAPGGNRTVRWGPSSVVPA